MKAIETNPMLRRKSIMIRLTPVWLSWLLLVPVQAQPGQNARLLYPELTFSWTFPYWGRSAGIGLNAAPLTTGNPAQLAYFKQTQFYLSGQFEIQHLEIRQVELDPPQAKNESRLQWQPGTFSAAMPFKIWQQPLVVAVAHQFVQNANFEKQYLRLTKEFDANPTQIGGAIHQVAVALAIPTRYANLGICYTRPYGKINWNPDMWLGTYNYTGDRWQFGVAKNIGRFSGGMSAAFAYRSVNGEFHRTVQPGAPPTIFQAIQYQQKFRCSLAGGLAYSLSPAWRLWLDYTYQRHFTIDYSLYDAPSQFSRQEFYPGVHFLSGGVEYELKYHQLKIPFFLRYQSDWRLVKESDVSPYLFDLPKTEMPGQVQHWVAGFSVLLPRSYVHLSAHYTCYPFQFDTGVTPPWS